MIFQVTAKKVFGADYEGLRKSFLIWAIVFLGLRIAQVRVETAPFILYLLSSSFTAGVMWLALSADDNRTNMMNLFMLPFETKNLNAAYVSALGLYVLATKTLGLLSVVWALSDLSGADILGSILCAVNAVWMSACVYTWRKRLRLGLLWCGLWCGGVLGILQIQSLVFPVGFVALLGNAILSFLLTLRADAYAFYRRPDSVVRIRGAHLSFGLVWRYLLRYMMSHKNYVVNTVTMWGVACVLPMLLGQIGGMAGSVPNAASRSGFFLPIGSVIVSMNTPICILLSCDPALERAVRFLPGQRKAFFLPYGLFLFQCNMTAETIYLCSWQMFFGGVSGEAVLMAVCFALLSAAGSALLEWFCPVRGWKIESDLWHHPRKYVVPGVLLLLAAAVGSMFVLG